MTKQTKLWALLVAAALVSPTALFLLAGVAERLADPAPGVIREARRAEISGDESAIQLPGEPSTPERSAGRREARGGESVATSSPAEPAVAAPAPETVASAPPDDGSEGDDDEGSGRRFEPARAGDDDDDDEPDDDSDDDSDDSDDDESSGGGDSDDD